jgi:alkylated DNA repair protein alkB family protein 4
MDDVVPMPDLLEIQPGGNFAGLSPGGETASDGLIANFELARQFAPDCPKFQGVRVFPDFLSPSEAEALLFEIDRSVFVKAQSGKRKQHYGPKINFNKKKMNTENFQGIPAYARRIEDRLRRRVQSVQGAQSEPIGDNTDRTDHTDNSDRSDPSRFDHALEAFETTDVFVLQYLERVESNLDFHLDDTFAYGELILDLSLESDSVLTFLRTRPGVTPSTMECVRVPLPARSLAAVYGAARFDWEHAILACDIAGRRTSITLRTLHADLLKTDSGQRVAELARQSCAPS